MKTALSFLVIFGATVATVLSASLPSEMKRCKVKDEGFFTCLAQAMEHALPLLKNGNKAIGVLPIEPLHIDAITIDQGGTSSVQIKLNMKNIDMHGMSASKVLKISGDIDKFDFYIESVTPEMMLKADYEVSGKVLLLPVSGKGPCSMKFVNTKSIHHLKGEVYEKKGKKHIRYAYDVKFEPENIVYNLENLFDGQKELSDNMNKVFNDNALEIYKELRFSVEETIGLVFQNVVNGLFDKVALEDIFLY